MGRSGTRSPRRTPPPEERQRDAERSRQRILDAALKVFSAKGFAGARVAEIAAEARVNAQLIAYYFGGKNGLYDALRSNWESIGSVFTASDQPFSAMIGTYLGAVFDHPAWARLLIWRALGDGSEQETGASQLAGLADAVEDIRRRQQLGEVTKEFDPEVILTVLWSAAMASVTIPQAVQVASGADLGAAEFRARYAEQLKRLFAGPEAT